MRHRLGVAAPATGVRVRPELAELRRTLVELLQQPGQARVVGVAARHRAEVGHGLRCGGGALVRRTADRAPGRVGRVGQEPEPRLVAPLRAQPRPVAVQRRGHRVPGQYVALGAGHQRGQVVEPVDQPEHARPHVQVDLPGVRRRRAGEVEDVVALVGVQTEGAAQRGQHLFRRLRTAGLLEPDDVVDADAGQHRQLLAAQPRHPPVQPGRQPDVLGPDLAPCAS